MTTSLRSAPEIQIPMDELVPKMRRDKSPRKNARASLDLLNEQSSHSTPPPRRPHSMASSGMTIPSNDANQPAQKLETPPSDPFPHRLNKSKSKSSSESIPRLVLGRPIAPHAQIEELTSSDSTSSPSSLTEKPTSVEEKQTTV
jgi:hypothetical protein